MAVGVDPKVDYAFKRVLGDARNADIFGVMPKLWRPRCLGIEPKETPYRLLTRIAHFARIR